MPTQCRLIELSKGYKPVPGDMWYVPWFVEDSYIAPTLSPEYKRDWLGKRPPIAVCLPNGTHWMIDNRFADGNGGWKENGWTITGEAPNITANPSINSMSPNNGYHGWLQNGILTDDLEGRRYP